MKKNILVQRIIKTHNKASANDYDATDIMAHNGLQKNTIPHSKGINSLHLKQLTILPYCDSNIHMNDIIDLS